MKFDYDNQELAIYEDNEEINGMDCITLWQTKDNICFQIPKEYLLKYEDDDGYGNKIYVLEKTGGRRKMKYICNKCGKEAKGRWDIPIEHGRMSMAIYPNKAKSEKCTGKFVLEKLPNAGVKRR